MTKSFIQISDSHIDDDNLVMGVDSQANLNNIVGDILTKSYDALLVSGDLAHNGTLDSYRTLNKIIKPLGFEPMVNDFIEYPEEKIRLEIVFTIIFQISLFHVLDISILGWLTCYIAFAINWCALQYTDHAWSKRDIKNGAWNLKINKTIQYVFLNYHLHLAHHQNPKVSWLHLPNFVDFSLNRPSFWKIYLSLWKGPKLTSEPPPGEMDAALERQLFE